MRSDKRNKEKSSLSDKFSKIKIRKDKKYPKETALANEDGIAVKTGLFHKPFTKKKVLKLLLLGFLTIFMAVVVYATIVIIQAPKIDTSDIYSVLNVSTVIYDDKGDEYDTVYAEDGNRNNVDYEQLPKNLINAFVALEDKTFWDHNGFNFIRILGAIKDSFTSGSISGTSTITQQLARNLYLKDSKDVRSIKRKIVEAYYTVILESNLSKEEIMEAYLNSIYFGYNSYGVQAASQSYFSKDVEDLTLEECAALAALPQSPSEFQLVELADNDNVSVDNKNVLKKTKNGTYLMNDTSKDRRELCLALMEEQGFINKEQRDAAVSVSLKKMLKPNYFSQTTASYFTDYVMNQVINDLMEEHDWSYDEAWDKAYTGGIKIYSTIDSQAQEVIQEEFRDDSNFPSAINMPKDGDGNVLSNSGNIVLYDYDDYFDNDGNFTFTSDEIKKKDDGSLVIMSGNRLNLWETEVGDKIDYSIEFKNLYYQEDGELYTIKGGYINVPQQYKSADKDGNVTISADFFKNGDYKDYFIFHDNGTVTVTSKAYTLNQTVIQPQAAMTIVENSTGYIKAMVGGRNTHGRLLYNRAVNPRQPGSSMKPLAVYSAALEQSAQEAANGKSHTYTDYGIDQQGIKFFGNYLTAASIVIDEKTVIDGKDWPKNAGGGYSGVQTMRSALQASINTCAVKIYLQVGDTFSSNLVDKFGISTLVTEGETNDLNPAALALGGMTHGVTTLDMASAYTVFPNNGTRKDTSCYIKVENHDGSELLKSKVVQTHEVLDPGVAWIMTDMLKSVVTSGLGGPASISGVQVGGKTGTTDEQYDIWFDGFTPNYSASLWIGNDDNFELSSMSHIAAGLWGRIMNQIDAAKTGSYKESPSNVIYSGGEYFITGTQGGVPKKSDLEKEVTICNSSGFLATPSCTSVSKKKFQNYGDESEKIPKYYCNQHNPDVTKYPISPDVTLAPQTPVTKPEDPEEPEDPNKPEPNPDPDNPDNPDEDGGNNPTP